MKDLWIKTMYKIDEIFLCTESNFEVEKFIIDSMHCFHTLDNFYNDSNRKYHNFNHIKNLLNYLNDFDDVLGAKEKLLIELSIWFHDVIYDPKSKENVLNSLLSFNYYNDVIFNLNNSLAQIVNGIILSTEHDDTARTKLEKIMCDIDLKCLSNPDYINDSLNIKVEYSHLSDSEWKEGRLKFLNTFLNKNRIYYTDKYYNLYENKAKENLYKEIVYLNNN